MAPKIKKGKKNAQSREKVLTAEEEEAKSSALIAKILSKDYGFEPNGFNPYSATDEPDFDNDGRNEDNDDDDFYPKPKKSPKAPRKSAQGIKKSEIQRETTIEEGPKTDTKTGVSEDSVIKGAWTKEEEAKFFEGLELHGRDWHKLANHVGTRDSNTVRSKAQKHFIKLFRDGGALPEKVRESGEGYTLSGKPLDPNSAAARPYLRLAGAPVPIPAPAPAPETSEGAEGVVPVPSEPKDPPEDKSAKPRKRRKDFRDSTESKRVALADDDETETQNEPKSNQPVPRPSSGRTEYSKGRLRNIKPAGSYLHQLDHSEPHLMFRCQLYGDDDSTAPQPFAVQIKPNAILVSDLHAHLMTNEVIGFLAGTWDASRRAMVVEEAFPCKSIVSGADHVEMDPENELDIRNQIMDKSLQIVGWYHSHPFFEPHPSMIDLENQRNYQHLFRDYSSDFDPFIGLIVGTYDPRLPSAQSFITSFHIPPTTLDKGEPRALRMFIDLQGWSLQNVQEQLLSVIQLCRDLDGRIHLDERWQPDKEETKLQKAIESLRLRVRDWTKAKQLQVDAQLNSIGTQLSDLQNALPNNDPTSDASSQNVDSQPGLLLVEQDELVLKALQESLQSWKKEDRK